MLTELFQKVSHRKRQQQTARAADVRQLAVLIGDAELGDKTIDIDVDHFAAVLDAEHLSEADLHANVERYKRRVQQAELAKQAAKRQSEAEAAEAAWRQADRDEGARRRKALANIQAMEQKMQTAIEARNAAESARSDLVAQADISTAERELNAQLETVNRRIATLRRALDQNARLVDGHAFDGVRWGSLNETPAVLARQTRHALGDKVGYTPERRKELESQLAAAERAVAQCEKELAAAEKEAARINACSQKLSEEKLRPENFPLVRSRPTRDELAKRHAERLGFGRHDTGVTVSTG